MLRKRALLTGSLALGLASILPAPALAFKKRRAHVVTALDNSGSTDGTFVSISSNTKVNNPSTYVLNMLSFAHTVRNFLGLDMEQSGMDEVDFEAFRWATNVSHLLPKQTLVVGKCQPQLEEMAQTLEALAYAEPSGSTDMPIALDHALSLFSYQTDRDVLNVVTDDDTLRTAQPYTLGFYKKAAEPRKLITNGFIWGNPHAMDDYFDKLVRTGGPTSFVLRADTIETVRSNWRKKFVLDLY